MPNIIIVNLYEKTVPVQKEGQSIIKTIHEQHIDWMHACGTKGRCTTCKMIVIKGQEHLSKETEVELKYRELGKLEPNERLACQCITQGDIWIKVPEQTKFPHMKYSD